MRNRVPASRYPEGHCFALLVNIYQAMDGGWVNEADKLAPQPSVRRDPALTMSRS